MGNNKKSLVRKAAKAIAKKYEYSFQWSDEDEAFIASITEHPGVHAHGDTMKEALHEIVIVAEMCAEMMIERKEKEDESNKNQEI